MDTAPPIVIIGAPRSGTNMLRDLLTGVPGLGTWPCDEINPIWRHGNRDFPSDELPAQLATPWVQSYVRKQFLKVASRTRAQVVVEKTCANSLRVPFVHRILPDARFVFIHRNGLDAIASAMLRWNGPSDLTYLARKARFVPPTDALFQGRRFVVNRLRAFRGGSAQPKSWGPRIAEMDALLATRPLDEVCALQWQRCVDLAGEYLTALPRSQAYSISYEDFVQDPVRGMKGLLGFIGAEQVCEPQSVTHVTSRSVGKGRQQLSGDQQARLQLLIGPTLERWSHV
jgi:Sulfotransferase family